MNRRSDGNNGGSKLLNKISNTKKRPIYRSLQVSHSSSIIGWHVCQCKTTNSDLVSLHDHHLHLYHQQKGHPSSSKLYARSSSNRCPITTASHKQHAPVSASAQASSSHQPHPTPSFSQNQAPYSPQQSSGGAQPQESRRHV